MAVVVATFDAVADASGKCRLPMRLAPVDLVTEDLPRGPMRQMHHLADIRLIDCRGDQADLLVDFRTSRNLSR